MSAEDFGYEPSPVNKPLGLSQPYLFYKWCFKFYKYQSICF